MKALPNGNIEITVALMPEAYAALHGVMERDGIKMVDAVNLAVMTLDHVSQMAASDGKPLGEAIQK